MTSLHGLVRLLLLTITGSVAVTSYAQQPPDVVQSDAFQNTAMGTGALLNNTPGGALGTYNTASGYQALENNTTASFNTAVGAYALNLNAGDENTSIGYGSLSLNNTGARNSAFGVDALNVNRSGSFNTAAGVGALQANDSGGSNTATGYAASSGNLTGSNNTAIGTNAMASNQGGSNNIAIGANAGYYIRGTRYNIDIGNVGAASDVGHIRLGTSGQQTATYIAGISNAHVAGSAVYITSAGQLGVLASSERYKTNIASMGSSSERVRELRPVTFHLKSDPKAGVQYGLIAEEVAKVYPELVIRGDKGQIEGVRYEELTPMLLNELQQQQGRLAEQQAELQDMRSQLADLRRALQERTH